MEDNMFLPKKIYDVYYFYEILGWNFEKYDALVSPGNNDRPKSENPYNEKLLRCKDAPS